MRRKKDSKRFLEAPLMGESGQAGPIGDGKWLMFLSGWPIVEVKGGDGL